LLLYPFEFLKIIKEKKGAGKIYFASSFSFEVQLMMLFQKLNQGSSTHSPSNTH